MIVDVAREIRRIAASHGVPLIFKSSFDKANRSSLEAGRGVGLDVVKKSIEDLRGTVEIDSQMGKGTTITIKLPLTLAIIDGLQVRVGNEDFIIPLSMVKECLIYNNDGKYTSNNRRLIELRGEMLPYVSLREFFSISGEKPQFEQMAIIENNNGRIGILVDEVVGQYQTVIKSLGKVYQNADGLSGATILGNGRVALILDIPKIETIARREEQEYIRTPAPITH